MEDQEPKTLVPDDEVENWSEHVENLVASGDADGAIAYLEHRISRLKSKRDSRDLALTTAMDDLAKLYKSRGDTMKAGELSDRLRTMEASYRKQDQDQEPKTLVPDEKVESWSEYNENLVACIGTDGATSYLELLFFYLELEQKSQDLELTTAMNDLANLYYSRGDTMKSSELLWSTFSIRNRIIQQWSSSVVSDHLRVAGPSKEKNTEESTFSTTANNDDETCVDDWETLAETDISLLSLKPKTEASQPVSGNLSQKETDSSSSVADKKPKRKGKGSFLYNESTLYSDTQGEFEETNDLRDSLRQTERNKEVNYGTRHVLVLYDLPASTRTTELEKVFEAYDAASVAIRWVNDTTALAVFCNPSLAESAKSGIPSRYKFRYLQEDDELLTQLKSGDLEPPRPRPKTSTAAIRRMIGHSFGIRISSPGSGIHEHRQQERERKERIAAQKASLEDAWGAD